MPLACHEVQHIAAGVGVLHRPPLLEDVLLVHGQRELQKQLFDFQVKDAGDLLQRAQARIDFQALKSREGHHVDPSPRRHFFFPPSPVLPELADHVPDVKHSSATVA